MEIYLSVDDTDNPTSIGSGQLAENLTEELLERGLIGRCSNITRHQLYYHQDIPYTSHNSAMCFSASTASENITELVAFSSSYLRNNSAPGSDPGLCIVRESSHLDRDSLIEFGTRAKSSILGKGVAYQLAGRLGIHLSEHGGTGDGVIGALAGVGLRLQGNDGRFRGWFNFGLRGEKTTAGKLCEHPSVCDVVDESGNSLSPESPIRITDEKIKTILKNHTQVIPVKTKGDNGENCWETLTRKEVKVF